MHVVSMSGKEVLMLSGIAVDANRYHVVGIVGIFADVADVETHLPPLIVRMKSTATKTKRLIPVHVARMPRVERS